MKVNLVAIVTVANIFQILCHLLCNFPGPTNVKKNFLLIVNVANVANAFENVIGLICLLALKVA